MLQKIGRFCIKLLSIVLFGALTALVILYAYGYQFDLGKKKVKKTSIIDLRDDIHQADIFLDGALQTHTLPYQIKNIVPGQHTLLVKKDGFFPWQKNLKVKDDFVTLIQDIFLIPEKTEPYIHLLRTLPAGYSSLFGADYVIWYKPNDSSLEISSFMPDGSLQERKIEVYRQGLEEVKMVSPHYVLAYFEDSVFALININDGGVKFFTLPLKAAKIEFNEDTQTLYFLQENQLLAAALSSLRLQHQDMNDFKPIAEDVDQYVNGFPGQIFFLSRGIFFVSDENRNLIHIPEQDIRSFTNLSFKKGQSYGALILRTKDGKRLLYGVDSHGKLTFLEEDAMGQPFFNSLDQILYRNTNHDLYVFDPKLLQKEFIPLSLEDEALPLGWITNDGSFLFSTSKGLKIGDILNNESISVLTNAVPNQLFAFDKFFFYLKDRNIFVVDWRKDL